MSDVMDRRHRPLGRRLTTVGVVAFFMLAALISASAAGADVVNPGSNFKASVTGGSLKVNTKLDLDVGTMSPSPQIKDVTVAPDGSLSAPATGLIFPQQVMQVDAPIVGPVDISIQIRAAAPITGSVDPDTGAVHIETSLTIQLTSTHPVVALGGNCYVGSPSSPIAFSADALPDGAGYDQYTGNTTVVDSEIAIPKATGCPTIVGQNVNDVVDGELGLPSPSGQNTVAFALRFKPAPHSESWVDPGNPDEITPEIVNDTVVDIPGKGAFRSWLESFTINGNDSRKFMTSRKGNTLRLSLLVKHDPGRKVTGLRIDDDWNATDDSDNAVIKPVTPVQPAVSGGFNYSRVTFEYQAPIAGMGVTCPEVTGGTMNRIADISVRAVLDNDAESDSSSSKIALSRDDCDVWRQDAPMVYDWQPVNPGAELTPGEPVTFAFRLDDTDNLPVEWNQSGGYYWRWRNLDTGQTTSPTKVCASSNQDGVMQTVNTTAPNRGRWVIEAELANLDNNSCNHIQLKDYWFWLGAVDVNSPQDLGGVKSPRINLTVPGRVPNVNGHYRPGASGDLTLVAEAEDTLDLAAGGKVQSLEWDLDGDPGNGVDGFETVRLGDSRTGLAPGQDSMLLETEDMAPGIYPVRVRAGDNGALGAADDIRRSTVSDTRTYMVNTPPTAQDLAVTTDYGKSVATPLVASDTNADGLHDPLTWLLETPPEHGYLAGEWPNRVYHPEDGFSGTDSYVYKVDDGFGGIATATVTITVGPKPADPVDPVDPDPDKPKLNHLEASFVEGRMNLNEGAGPSTSGVPVVDSTVPDTPVTFTTDYWNKTTGQIDAPASDLKFPSKSVQMSITDPIPLDLDVKIEFGALGRITGSYNATSGEMKLNFNAHALITVTASNGALRVLTCDVTPMPLAFSSRGPDLVDPGEAGKRPAKNWKAADFKPVSRDGAVTSLWSSLPASTAISEPLAPLATCAGTLDALIGGKGGFWLGGKVKVDGNGGNTDPPNGSTAIFDGKRLHLRLKCGRQYKPACKSTAVPVTKKTKVKKVRRKGKVRRVVKKGKPMAKPIRKKIKAGKWIKVSFLIKPKYRAKVQAMSKKNAKTLFVQQKIKSNKIGKKKFKGNKPRTVYHRYKVRTAS